MIKAGIFCCQTPARRESAENPAYDIEFNCSVANIQHVLIIKQTNFV